VHPHIHTNVHTHIYIAHTHICSGLRRRRLRKSANVSSARKNIISTEIRVLTCMHIYIHIYTYIIYLYPYIHIYYIFISTCDMCVCVSVQNIISTEIRVLACIHICIHIYMFTYLHRFKSTCVCVRVYTFTVYLHICREKKRQKVHRLVCIYFHLHTHLHTCERNAANMRERKHTELN